MAKLPKEAINMYNDPTTVKTIATVDKTKAVNLVPLMSAKMLDDETIVFVDCDLGKTKANLDATKRASIAVHEKPMLGYQSKGMFVGWQDSGPVFDKYSKEYKEMMAKNGVTVTPRAIGTLKITEAYSIAPIAKGFKVA